MPDLALSMSSPNASQHEPAQPTMADVVSQMTGADRRIFLLLTCPPKSTNDLHGRPSLRNAFIKFVSRARAYEYLPLNTVPDKKSRFQPPRWRYGYKFTFEQALAVNEQRLPPDQQLSPLSWFRECCDDDADPVAERARVAGSWLETRVNVIMEGDQEAQWCHAWENGERILVLSFRDTWRLGEAPGADQVAAISELMFGKYVEPMWYVDAFDCFWGAKY
ncbi:hypothetical protein PC9H_010281 [Pleurotus ostreatus]|uniref:Uncharacterized protein n=3 Tax=Pleurotaceae TaxID=104366 RepID=A0A8H6ZN83_PLEOS|nr:uncharacterized protein PC9H_002776 [Pleurotus ostreatus]XP_036629164.1 uncharacterized protein PC9H_010281 [Pleurotus ostreatus]KDQ21972.1 hypothetical protein PLEOSDRAFT_1098459 [Pleurotus ostreatus PC15]KAF7416032.1 hypothetical protein PC9H_002776 [Pleurotus ostreatus]KAF7424970.1 hypothetical protein PC9H_010281 [Pleurotus ostreatus]KAJ8694398.1 hypothetical protein PTI98_009322 [Pleurotus ostreatus]KAJ8694523.1 hypothetical protein PTI98_007187 [Pleurotus ostreatus]